MAKTNIVVIGAGFAGVAATKKLAKHFKKNNDVLITLIDRHSYQTYMTELHEVAAGRVEPDAIQYDLQRLFNRNKNVDIVTDEVKHVNHESKEVTTVNTVFHYDYLIVAMGGEPNTFNVPGVDENGFTLWSWEDANTLRRHIKDTVEAAAIEHDVEKRKAMLTMVVSGAGFTGVEMIGDLMEWKDRLAKDNKLDPNEFSFYLVEAAPIILGVVTEKESSKAERYLNKNGVKIIKGNGVAKVEEDSIELSDGTIIPTHTLIWTAGVKANTDTEDYGIEKGRAGRLVANQYMEAQGAKDVYLAGDIVYYEEPDKDNRPTPQIVQNAEQTGHTAAANIIAAYEGKEKVPHKSNYQGFMISIGSRYGVAYLMDKIHLSGFIAMAVKHLINLFYFLSIGSVYYFVQYIHHEFFHIRDGRNIFRKHLSRYGNVLWALPLRLYYGSMWLIEGLKKLFGLFGTTSWFGNEVTLPFSWLQDPTSGATEAVEEVAKPVFGLNYVYGEEPMMVFKEMPGWFESIMKFMLPNQDVALFFQKFMTLVEVAIGLAIIFGLFTWLANAATVALVVSFSLSGMFYWVNMWFVPVAIALMNGSGRAVGLDYYVMPWLQKKLGKWWYGDIKSIYEPGIEK
ncbi:FAD-dependent oxidoreductase [Jeotgalibaca caeni]|uniref:FAD-dependent oxidoreductase n=1 Tax=Jeotgalibaca caeni TaxID=3028623 RepID=UPI00237E6F0F|nr:FAD-dependent oxidoreductase [Jeotgalibaca caeni]MDE1548576.1 FAD-dependent oxidoreductase [Jeotgalibaca caeni]